MDTEKKERIREVVRDVISKHIEYAVDETFESFYIRDEIWGNLPDDLSEDEEVTHCMIDKNDESGSIDNTPVEKLIDELTNSYMERFEE